jgi:hypothetical protein
MASTLSPLQSTLAKDNDMAAKIVNGVRKTFRMKKGMLAKWLAALRSGEYAQCKMVLQSEEGPGEAPSYCCLGVLQKVVDGDVERGPMGTPLGLPTQAWFNKNGITNIETSHRANIYTRSVGYGGQSASGLNDMCELTFPQIADVLETCCETY